MEDSTSRAEAIRPMFLKAGIPLAVSAAGFIISKILSNRRGNHEATPIEETPVSSLQTNSQEFRGGESFLSLDSASSTCEEDQEQIEKHSHFMQMSGSYEIVNKNDYEEEILGLRIRIEELQKRELELETQFLHYCDVKEQESILMELKNMLLLKTAYLEFMHREASSMEDEMKRLENLMAEYYRVLQQLEHWKSENRLLQRKVKKLSRKTKAQSQIIWEKDLKIKAGEAEIWRNYDALEERSNVIEKLKDEVRELESLVQQLQEQKYELVNQLNMMENSASSVSKIEAEGITIEDYNQLADEYEQLQRAREAEVSELIYLRWSNACLKHELMRYHAQKECEQEEKNNPEPEFEGSGEIGDFGMGQHLDGLVLEQQGGLVCSRKKKLLQKFKRWVEGSEKMKPKMEEKENHETKCFGRHSVSDEMEEVEESVAHARKSCSSA
ncbi:hypothetical protein SLEP1_g21597 [Rubroshorea leprosula]|uniref:Protein CHUP1, chloroplastic n=1 Tax=Rubroshorea leprosula TaxID=152421 RepID=A0AAV5JFP8_9ROSI|nr:hypothetical protein SLEP1_g21597 [Rubroshorea leprosula]